MKTTRMTKTILVAAVILLTSGAIAYAHGGYGAGRRMGGYGGYDGHMMGPDHGWGHMMGYGPKWGWQRGSGGLTEKEAVEIETAREKFYNDTKELRGKIDEQAIVLRNEMAKDDPDSGKVAELQKALSDLKADFDQKAVAHQLEMRKILPKSGQGLGYGRGGGRGYGGYCRQ